MDLEEASEIAGMLAPDAEAERADIDPGVLKAKLKLRVERMLEDIEAAIYQVALDSRIVADLFWEEQMEHYHAKDPGVLGVRVRVHKGTLEVAYFRNAFTKKGGTKRDKAFYAKHIRKSGKYRYTARDFAGANEWEKALALEHEEEHEKNRKLFAELSKARRSLRAILKDVSSG